MTRGILIAGNESPLFSAAAAEALRRVETFASAQIPNRFYRHENKPESAEAAGSGIRLSWNPSSSISARTLVVAAENRLKQINDAILVCCPPAVYKSAEALTPEEIEILVNDHIRGWFFLVRELLVYFRRRGSGSLSFVVPEISPEHSASPLKIINFFAAKLNLTAKTHSADISGPPAAASFEAFAKSAVAALGEKPYQVMGFSSAEGASEEEFAAWFFKKIDAGDEKNSGRWHRFHKFTFFR